MCENSLSVNSQMGDVESETLCVVWRPLSQHLPLSRQYRMCNKYCTITILVL